MDYYLISLVLVYFFHTSACIDCDKEPKTPETTLKKKLLCSTYDKSERPVQSHTSAVKVEVDLILQNFDYDQDYQKMYLNVWLLLSWKDEFLHWNPVEHQGVQELLVESDEIWTPDLLPFSSYYSNNLDTSCTTPKCQVKSDGKVNCVPACEYHTLCETDYTNWPFDQQNCTMLFGMWAETGNQVDLSSNGTSYGTGTTNVHNQWMIKKMKAEHHRSTMIDSSNRTTTYPTLVFNYLLERHSGTYWAMFITPAFLMVIGNLVSISLRCDSLERMVLLGGNTFTQFVFLESIYWRIPFNGSSVPTFVVFMRDSLFISTLLLIFTVFLKHVYLNETEASPRSRGLVTAFTSTGLGQLVFGSTVKISSMENGAEPAHETTATTDGGSSDTAILVESTVLHKPNEGESIWKTLALILDRLLYAVTTAVYIFMIIKLLPN
ncbi:acetylcholine receptor subunit alpha-like [Uranotaenia lowii]|uniref:acetylcholine receptor subunit alpha-like n=1 Tax=Uranotaenia lowii TaxID=190385 RepID=UPI002478933B|nr:acetylcholine receptor subunit alpha-like [Uranotaenia lowii]